MWIRVYMVASYMVLCSVILTKPCKYFQLNSRYFNRQRGLFSKIELDQSIPRQWRLRQCYLHDDAIDSLHFPVFIKPEWGQNASGISHLNSAQELAQWRNNKPHPAIHFIVQEAATGHREFEIFYIKDAKHNEKFAVLTVSESCNTESDYPINSINNPNTYYVDLTDEFSPQAQQHIWQHVRQIGDFKIARVSVKTNTLSELLNGQFQVVEVNVFIPMPINLLDSSLSKWQIIKRASIYMWALAKVTKHRDLSLREKPVFTKIMLYNRQNRFLNYLNEKI